MPTERQTALFRQHAVAHQAPRLFGGALVSSNVAARLLALFALSLTLGLIALLVLGTYELRERVPGYIMPTAGLVRVMPPRIGVITGVEVADGDKVSAGQPLF